MTHVEFASVIVNYRDDEDQQQIGSWASGDERMNAPEVP